MGRRSLEKLESVTTEDQTKKHRMQYVQRLFSDHLNKALSALNIIYVP